MVDSARAFWGAADSHCTLPASQQLHVHPVHLLAPRLLIMSYATAGAPEGRRQEGRSQQGGEQSQGAMHSSQTHSPQALDFTSTCDLFSFGLGCPSELFDVCQLAARMLGVKTLHFIGAMSAN